MKTSIFMTIENDVVKFDKIPMEFPLKDFPALYKDFDEAVGNPGYKTREVEASGREQRNLDFSRPELKDFIKLVCSWSLNDLKEISEKNICSGENENRLGDVFREAAKCIEDQKNAGIESAANKLCSLKYVELSTASRLLRMLFPEYCVAYRNKPLKFNLPYSYNGKGYAEFCADCVVIAEELNKLECGKWRAADVEAAIFHTIRP